MCAHHVQLQTILTGSIYAINKFGKWELFIMQDSKDSPPNPHLGSPVCLTYGQRGYLEMCWKHLIPQE